MDLKPSSPQGLRPVLPHWPTTVFQPPTLAEFEAAEINDLLLVTQAVTAVRTHCQTLKNTALSQEWPVPASMTDGLYGIRYAIPSPDSPCNCFSLAALYSLNQCQGEVLRYMHCTHTTAHSNDTVKHTHCLAQARLKYPAQVTDKKAG